MKENNPASKEILNFLASYPFAAATRRTYENILLRFLVEYEPSTVTASDMIGFVSKTEWGNARRCVALAACLKFIRWKFGDKHPALTAKIKRLPGKPQRALNETQAIQLINSFNQSTPKGARDVAIFALAIDTGLRESEICRLEMKYIDVDRRYLEVITKGGRWEAAVFSEQTANYIANWLFYRKKVNGQGYLFTNTFTGKGLTPGGLQSIVREWGKTIGVKLSPHDFRRSFAVLATDLAGAPERILMAGGRWRHSEMINRYTRTLKLESMRRYLPMPKLSKMI